MALTFASMFSGIGSPDLAASRLGLTHLWGCEIAPFPRKVFAKRFPGVRLYDDVRRLHAAGECVRLAERRDESAHGPSDAADLRAVGGADAGCPDCAERPDILWASPPCQDLSVAGKRAGLAGARSGLFYDFARVAGELRPTWLLMEQVPGLFSSNGGRDFELVVQTLDELGYGLSWRVLDSRYLGVPQRRRRIYLVGCLGEPCPLEVLFEPEGSQWDLAAGGEEGEGAAEPFGVGVAGSLGTRNRGDELDRHGAYVPGPSVMRMREGKDGGGKGPLIREDESLTLATSNDQALFVSENQRAEVRLTEHARQLTSGGGKPGQGYPAVMVTSGPKMFDASGYHRESVSADVTPTVAAYEQPMWVAPSVRRLTPTECCRLQGFPDRWTCLCDKPECVCPDGPQYAALGNSVTVNAASWIISRIPGVR